MIQKIKKVSNFGIFNEIENNPDYTDFNKLNLFYGLNGSGKSTLSHLCSLLESKEIKSRFPNSKWNITKKDGNVITESDDIDANLNVRVFDKGFIERNLNWNETIQGILVVSEDKNEEIKQLKNKKEEKAKKETDILKTLLSLNGKKGGEKGLIKSNNNFLSESAKNIKQKFQLIEVEDTHLSNYNKTKIENSLNSNKVEIKKNHLTVSEVEKLAQTIKPQDKEEIVTPNISSITQISIGYEKIVSILSSQITSKIIENLKDNLKKSDWVKTGLEYHKEDDECSFCGNNISKERMTILNNHFSDSFKENQEQINSAITWIKDFENPELPSVNSLYKEYQDDYKLISSDIQLELTKLNESLNKWVEALEIKASNPFEQSSKKIIQFEISIIENLYSKVITIIKNHNKKYLSASTIIQEAKNKLEIEYIKSEIKRYDYYKQKEIENITTKKEIKLKEELVKLEVEISKLNSLVSTEALGATKFNTDLYKFLGRKDIALDPQINGGYKIQRNGSLSSKGSQLSEGEKTAIAFVYFINKLTEQDNKINETIIIVDDPISSFDSNNLFSSYSYLKLHCNDAKQLFVLTHNFNYYRLVRDWFDTKNKSQKQKHQKNSTKPKTICNIYAIESFIKANLNRASLIKNADSTLLEYSSEYHYLFKKLVTFSIEDKLDLDNAYQSANISRKILETFLKFKHPKKSNDFKQLLEKALKKTSFKEKEEYIYRFINKYSHAQDFDNDSSDNKLDEGVNVTKDILSLIKEIDEIHYEEMIEVCQN